MAASDELDKFFNSFETLPGLIRNLALSVSQAQTELDRNYVESLAQFTDIINTALAGKDTQLAIEQYKTLFQAIAPSRYQFTETVVEVRADLQASSETSFSLDGNVGINAGIFAVAVNASYAKRSNTDYRAAALIRTVLNAIPADPTLVDKLLPRGGEEAPSVSLPPRLQDAQTAALGEALQLLPAATKSGGADASGDQTENDEANK